MAKELPVAAAVLSPGTSCGPAVLAGIGASAVSRRDLGEAERPGELASLAVALDASVRALRSLAKRVEADLGADKAEIFESHADILEDGDLRAEIETLVRDSGYSAAAAVREVTEANAREMEELDDEYFRARSEDFRDIGNRVIAELSREDCACPREGGDAGSGSLSAGDSPAPRFPPIPSIVVSPTLSPAQTVSFHLPHVLGFVVASGGVNSHAAILARSLGIPAAVIPEEILRGIENGTVLALNGESSQVVLNPEQETLSLLRQTGEAERRRSERLASLLELPAVTPCGRRIGLYANAGGMKDLAGITDARAEGIGLFRTEFLFMEESSFPSDEKQAAYYRRVLETMGDRPVIFRLLDIGADKPLPYAPHPRENNPFLGWRGIRWLIDNPDVLLSQLRALLLASAASGRTVRIMVPMVCRPSEMAVVRELVDRIRPETGGRAILGMMVETPAAAMTVGAFKGLSDFVSVGSNDLTQYTLAADRENELLGDLYSEFHPAVLSLMKKTCEDARKAGMETGICGEFASRPEAAVYLAAMGFDELSMSCRGIPGVKEVIRSLDLRKAQDLLGRALLLPSAREIRSLSVDFLRSEGIGS